MQRDEKWFKDRLGKITASRFSDVLTKGQKGEEFGKTATGYAYEIIAERMTGISKPNIKANALEWGTEWEIEARQTYETETFTKVHEVDYVSLDNTIGGSPDGLIGDKGGIEIKCPYNSTVHLVNILNRKCPKEYLPQVQGYMWITKREWWDFVSFDPRYKKNRIVISRINRDNEYIKILSERLDKFQELIQSIEKGIA